MNIVRIGVCSAFVSLLVLGCGAASPAGDVAGTSVQATHSWGSYHWARTANPFTLKLGDNVSAAWDTYLANASTDWTASSVLNTSIVTGTAKGRCRPTGGRVEVCSGTYGNNGWLGLASIWASGNHITQGTVKVNDTYYNTAQYNTPAWRAFVMCQEIGHTFGLNHQDENFTNPNLGTCMDYTNNPSSNQHPNAHDYAQLESIYAHLDGTTTVGAAPPGFSGANVDHKGSWGEEAWSNGRGSIYVRDFGGGHRIITHVLWVP